MYKRQVPVAISALPSPRCFCPHCHPRPRGTKLLQCNLQITSWYYSVAEECSLGICLLHNIKFSWLFTVRGAHRIFPRGGPYAAEGVSGWGHHGEYGARAYNGGLEAEPPSGSRDKAPGQEVRGRSPLKLKAFLVIGCPTEPANLAPASVFLL